MTEVSEYFEGKIAIVTGASSGIGRATALLLAKRGARVVAFARNASALAELVVGHEGRIVPLSGDIADPTAIERLFDETEAKLGDCDLLVNNAGMIDPKPCIDVTAEEWDRMFAVNVRGAFLASRRALRNMIAKRSGAIVNVASISGVPGPEKFPGWVSYCASKAAVIAMTEAMAVEVKGVGVRVNAVSPGSVDTQMWARASGGAPASMTPEEIAETIAFLGSDASRPMNGQNLDVWSV